jgi:hypothetical protein
MGKATEYRLPDSGMLYCHPKYRDVCDGSECILIALLELLLLTEFDASNSKPSRALSFDAN